MRAAGAHATVLEHDDRVALAVYANERVAEATARAELSHGPAPTALGRLCREYFELGDVLTVMSSGTVADDCLRSLRGAVAAP